MIRHNEIWKIVAGKNFCSEILNNIFRLWVDMSFHSETLFWFWPDQFLFLLLNAAFLPIS